MFSHFILHNETTYKLFILVFEGRFVLRANQEIDRKKSMNFNGYVTKKTFIIQNLTYRLNDYKRQVQVPFPIKSIIRVTIDYLDI